MQARPQVENIHSPPGITHSVVIQWLSYQNEEVRADRNDHGKPQNEFVSAPCKYYDEVD